MKEDLLYRGSVKDIYRLAGDELLFRFSDRYSIFDWGEMPDAIEGKGRALAEMGAYIFQLFQQKGFRTHWLKPGENPSELIVRKVEVPKDSQVYRSRPRNTLIPLEVIYRFGVPKGSSLLKRFTSEADWKAAGYDRPYSEGEFFAEPRIDYTTKLEKIDRPLNSLQAKELAVLDSSEFAALNQMAMELAKTLRKKFEEVGLCLWDGKFEFAFGSDREIVLVDSVGLDEMRLTYEGIPLSKELLRQAYAGSSWQIALEESKLNAGQDFKIHCITQLKQVPQALPSETLNAISEIYRAVSQLLSTTEAQGRVAQLFKIKAALRTLGRMA